MSSFFPAQSRPLRWHWLLASTLFAAVLLWGLAASSPVTFGQARGRAAEAMTTTDATKLREALADYDQGWSEQAKPILQDLLVHYPANFDINETLGLIYAEAGEFTAALPLLERAAHLQPGAPIARANLGTVYLKLNQPRKALPELEAAARFQPRDQQTQTNLAHAYLETNQPAKAAHAFASAAALGPLDADTMHDRALALLDSSDAAGAKRVLDAIPQSGRNDATEEIAGEAEERLGNYRQAEEHFSEAARLNPTEPNIYAWVVELLRHFSWQPAVKVADYGTQLFPSSTRLKAARGIAFYADNRYKEAATVFSDLLTVDPGNATWASLLGRNCALIADTTITGCDSLQRFADQHPRNAEAATYAATALLHQPAEKRDNSRARALLQQAAAADPSLADTYYQFGVLDQEETHWQDSTTPLEKAIALNPVFAEAHYRLARAYSHLGRREDAAREIALQQRYAKEQKDSVDARLKEVTTFLTSAP
jgi:tetratricopeptide (TPR) repeat protein